MNDLKLNDDNNKIGRNQSTIIKIYYQNVNGLRTERKRFRCTPDRYDFDIIALTETGLNKDHESSTYFDPSYKVYRKDRCEIKSKETKDTKGTKDMKDTKHTKDMKGTKDAKDIKNTRRKGGVLIALNSKFDSEEITISDTSDLECICVKIKLKEDIFIYIYCLYIPPSKDKSYYEKHLIAIKSILTDSNTIIIAGDFNIPDVEWKNNDFDGNFLIPANLKSKYQHKFLQNLQKEGFFQVNHINNDLKRKLDLIFTNDFWNLKVERPSVPLTLIENHHPPIFIVCEITLLGMQTSRFEQFKSCIDFASLVTHFSNLYR